jgi:hypothetical protein
MLDHPVADLLPGEIRQPRELLTEAFFGSLEEFPGFLEERVVCLVLLLVIGHDGLVSKRR